MTIQGDWSVYLGLTMEGALGPRLDVAKTGGSITHTLNDHDAVQVTVSEESLRGVGREWWSVRSGCLVITYTDAYGEERIVSACPISSPPSQSRKAGTVTFTGKGVSWLLEDRVVLTRDFPASDYVDLRKSKHAPRDRTFEALIAGILWTVVDRKRQGYLPIDRSSATIQGIHDRTFEGWNLSNNGAWKRIKEITEVDGGPDVAFRPEWANPDHTTFRWRCIVGTDEQQTLPQSDQIFWDATIPGTDVATISITSSSDDLAHRVYATGAGEGAAIALSMAEMKTIPEYMPIVEKVISESDAEIDDKAKGTSKLLTSKAKGTLFSNNRDQLSLSVRSDPEQHPIGTWWCGEAATVTTEGWLMVPDGEHLLRIISTKYTLGSDIVEVECQEDVIGGDYEW